MTSLLSNLVAYWKFDESSGDAADSSGNGNTLTNVNATPFVSAKINNGADMEASSGQCFITGDAFDINSDFTIAFWYKPESLTSGIQRIVSKYETVGDQRAYLLFLQQSDMTIRLALSSSGAAGTVVDSGVSLGTFTNGTFYHFAVVYDKAAGTVDFYKNGAALGAQQTGYPTSIFNSNTSFNVGCNSGNSADFLDGVLDELGIWLQKLSASDIALLYNSGSGLAYPFNLSTTITDTATTSDTFLGTFSTTISDAVSAVDSVISRSGFSNLVKNVASWINRTKN